MKLTEGFDLLATAPAGVARLRELILAFAVQGKLVTQDASDEPATDLLTKILVAKAEKLGAVTSRRSKRGPGLEQDDESHEIPESWTWARLSDLTSVLNGRAYAKNELLEAGDVPVLRVGNLFTSNRWYYSDLRLDADKYCDEGDLLYAWSASFGPFIWPGPRAIYHYHIWKLVPYSDALLNRKYLYTFLQEKTQEIKASGHGVAMVHMTKEKMEKILVPLPPLHEQGRIVAKVTELMQLCDELEVRGRLEAEQHTRLTETLFEALAASESAHALAENWSLVSANFDLLLDRPETVEAFEQTILQLAMRGLLVEQDPKDEAVSDLLKRIRTQKDSLIAAGKIKRDKPASPVADDELLFDLPTGWAWVRTPQIGESRLGKMLDKAKNSGASYPYLRNTNVQWNRFELDDVKLIQLEEHELDEYRLQSGDLLICEGGEPGRCAIWREQTAEMYFQKALHRFRALGGVRAEYIALCLEADAKSGRLAAYFTGATIKHFAGQELARYCLPLPPVAEQERIIARVEELRHICADLRARLIDQQTCHANFAAALVEQTAAIGPEEERLQLAA